MPAFILPIGSDDAQRSYARLDTFTQGYIEAMFFTSTGYAENDELEHVTLADLSPDAWERIKVDCAAFQSAWAQSIEGEEAKAGRDFWYTRNRHGCGFWDGDWIEPHATELTEAAHAFGEVDLYLGDDGLLYL